MAIWLAFFPVSLLFNFGLGSLLNELDLFSRTASTAALTPLMAYLIPLSTHLLANWLHPALARSNQAAAWSTGSAGALV